MSENQETSIVEEIPKYKSRQDALVEWEKVFEQSGRTNQQLIGELISGGAKMTNYSANVEGSLWKPTVYKAGERDMITIALGGHILGPRFGVETFQVGLNHVVEIRGSDSMETEKLFMVPYLRFTGNGEIDRERTNVLIFNEAQVNQLKGLLAQTKT